MKFNIIGRPSDKKIAMPFEFKPIAALCVIAFLTGPVQAGDVLDGPCKADVMLFCKDVKPGSGRILRCLRRNADRLTPACKAHRADKAAEIRQRMLACQSDAEKLCKDMRPGRGRIHKCLKSHEEELTPACLAEVEKVK